MPVGSVIWHSLTAAFLFVDLFVPFFVLLKLLTIALSVSRYLSVSQSWWISKSSPLVQMGGLGTALVMLFSCG